jgi:signal transduction histidine kinase
VDQRRVIQCHIRDVTERKRSETALRQLSRRLLTAEDGERRRIAKELHDSTAQDLVAVMMALGGMRQEAGFCGGDKSSKTIEDSLAILENCTHEIRTLAYLLHPPRLDEAGLLGAIRHYTGGFGERTGIAMTLELQNDLGQLPEDVELVLFRILQEGLGNVHRHAKSRAASVRLARDDRATILEITDVGQGFPEGVLTPNGVPGEGSGVGIAGMRERLRQVGGRLEIRSAPECTVVRAILPPTFESE